MNANRIARAAYARHLLRLSQRLEHLARLGRGIIDPSKVAQLWSIQRATLRLSELLDPDPKPLPAVPDFLEEKE